MTLVDVVAATKHVDGRVALAPTTMHVDPGEIVLVVGPARSGKTTLVEVVAGWTSPDHGVVRWAGTATPPSWTQLTVVPQALALIDELTVLENVMLPARAARVERRRDRMSAMAQLEQLGLDRLAERTATEISVGERQRVMVARALWIEPAVVVADEPVAHQDAAHASAVFDALRAAVSRGAGCIVASRTADFIARPDRTVALAAP